MKKSFLALSIAALLVLGSLAAVPASAYAHGDGCEGSHCAMMQHEGGKEHGGCPIAAKFFKKAHHLLENQQELGLSDQQVSDIKALKFTMKKSEIQNAAAMQIFMLDVEQKLSEPKVDTAAISALIDSQAAAMASSAKESVGAYTKLMGILTPEQVKKMKEIWLEHEAKEHGE